MVDFGCGEVAVKFDHRIDEHHALRDRAGMIDVLNRRAIDLHRAGAHEFLRGVHTNAN